MHVIEVFTDGSSLIKGNFYEASSGCLIFVDNEHIASFGAYHDNGTNSVGELYAIQYSLDYINELIFDNPELADCKIIITSDSQYVINSFSSWMYSWMKQGLNKTWLTSSGDPVMYQNVFKYVLGTYIHTKRFKIKFVHMHGHIGQKISVEKAYGKYKTFNADNISMSEFLVKCERNAMVDKLVEEIRVKKLYYYHVGSSEKWVIRKRKSLTRNGRILIRSPLKRK